MPPETPFYFLAELFASEFCLLVYAISFLLGLINQENSLAKFLVPNQSIHPPLTVQDEMVIVLDCIEVE